MPSYQTPVRQSCHSRPDSELSQGDKLDFSSLDSPVLWPIMEGGSSPRSSLKGRKSSLKKVKQKRVVMGRRPSIVMFTPETKGGLDEQKDDDKEGIPLVL